MTAPATILFVLTGSIACYKACQVISRLRQDGHVVQVVASAAALRFVGEATLEGLSGLPVATDLYEPDRMMEHIHLIRRADVVVLAPATANTINKLAAGIGDDLVSTLFLAHRFDKPFLVAPAMNTAMRMHPVTRASLQTLQALGLTVLDGDAGSLACGETGEGRLVEPDALHAAIEQALSTRSATNAVSRGKVLVTAGGTREPIDAVRAITNLSTGGTGTALARALSTAGFDVTVLLAAGSVHDTAGIARVERFGSFADLDAALRSELADPDYQAVIHAAAVSDYSVADADATRKQPSDAAEWTLQLRRNPKLVDGLRDMAANPALRVVAFKLTAQADAAQIERAVQRLQARSGADWVVHNDLARMVDGRHPFTVFGRDGRQRTCEGPAQLAEVLVDILLETGPG